MKLEKQLFYLLLGPFALPPSLALKAHTEQNIEGTIDATFDSKYTHSHTNTTNTPWMHTEYCNVVMGMECVQNNVIVTTTTKMYE